MEPVYVSGTRQERVGIEQPAIELYDLSKKKFNITSPVKSSTLPMTYSRISPQTGRRK